MPRHVEHHVRLVLGDDVRTVPQLVLKLRRQGYAEAAEWVEVHPWLTADTFRLVP